MANTTIPNLPPAISLDGTELWELVQNGVSRRATTQQLVNLASSGTGTVTLINTAGALTGGPITGSGTISLAANAVTNQYLAPMGPGTLKGNLTGSTADPQDVTVNAVLDSIGATPGSMLYRGAGAWALVPPGTTGQYLTTSGAVPQWGNLSVGPSSLTPTGVSAGTYGTASAIPQFTVLASGQLSAAGNVSIQISTSQVTGLGTMATQNATAVAITGGTMNGVVIGGGAPAAASFTNILAGTWLGTAIGVAYGGTGATTAPGARSNLGAAASGAVGSSGITMATARLLGRSTAGTGAIEEITIGANLTLSGGVLSATGGGGGGSGTVTSIDVSGGTTGLTTSGGPVTTSGTITLAGTLGTANGGTGLSSWTAGDLPFYATGTSLSKLAIGAANTVLTSGGTAPQWSTSLTLAGTVSAIKFIPVSGGTVTGNGMYLSGTNEISFSTNGVRQFTILNGGATIPNGLAVNTSQGPTVNGVTVWNLGEVSINNGNPSGSNQTHLRMLFSGAEPRLVFGAYNVSGGSPFGIFEAGSFGFQAQRMFFDTNNRVMVGSLTPFRGNTGAQFGALQVGFGADTNVSIFAANSVSTSAFTILGTSGDLQISTFDARNIIFGRNFNTTFAEAMRLTSTGGMTVSGTTTLSALTASTVLTLNASKEIVGVTSVPVANGGTGATDAATARTNLTAQKTITSGTATPTGGVSGDIYLQYT